MHRRCLLSWQTRQKPYHMLAHDPHQLPVRITLEVVEKQKFLAVLAHPQKDILFLYVTHEKLRQTLGVYHLLSRLFHVLHDVPRRSPEAHRVQRLKIAPPEPLVEVCVLHRLLPRVRLETVIFHFYQFPRHRPLGDIEETVEVQPLLLGRTLPHAHIPPALPETEIAETVLQPLTETLLVVQFTVVGKRCNIILWTLVNKGT